MPLTPNFLERLMFLNFNQGPAPALDMWSGAAFRIVLAAIRLNLFETLNQQPLTSANLAQKLSLDGRGTQMLLDTLEALGYVTQKEMRYENSRMTRKWLTQSGAMNFSAYFQFWGVLLEKLFGNLEESIRTGKPPVHLYEWIETEPEASRFFQDGMVAIARFVLPDLLKKIKLPPIATKLLDVGGGHAMYSAALCHIHPNLSATVIDSQQASATGHKTVKTQNLTDRVRIQEGSFLTEDLGDGYDAVLVFNIVHGFSAETNIELFRKVAAALKSGGQIIVLEQLADGAPLPMGNAISKVLGMSYFHMLGGQLYKFDEISNWLMKAGFDNLRKQNILKASSALITATKR